MTLEYTKAFELITDKLEEELKKSGYTREKVAADDESELAALFTSENVAYSVIYVKDKQQMILRTCPMTAEEGPDNDWKTLSTWLYDDFVSTQKDAESIANDFIDGVSGTVAIKRAKQTKSKKKKSDDGNADPKFLAKRFVTVFPELREEIQMDRWRRIATIPSAELPSPKSTSLPSCLPTSRAPTARSSKSWLTSSACSIQTETLTHAP